MRYQAEARPQQHRTDGADHLPRQRDSASPAASLYRETEKDPDGPEHGPESDEPVALVEPQPQTVLQGSLLPGEEPIRDASVDAGVQGG